MRDSQQFRLLNGDGIAGGKDKSHVDKELNISDRQAADRQVAIDLLRGTAAVSDGYRNASPLDHVDEETALVLVVDDSADDVNPVEHSRRLVAAIHQADAEVIYAQFLRVGMTAVLRRAIDPPGVPAKRSSPHEQHALERSSRRS